MIEKELRAKKLYKNKLLKRRKYQTHQTRYRKVFKASNHYKIAGLEQLTHLPINKDYYYREDGNIRGAGQYSGVEKARYKTLVNLINEGFENYNETKN